jgi:hypothetical protein
MMALFLFVAASAFGQSSVAVYTDGLQNGWENWSWATCNFTNTTPVHSAPYSISVSCGAYQAVYFHNPAFSPALYSNLVFWINGGSSGGQPLQVNAANNSANQTVYPAYALPSIPGGNVWTQYVVPISALRITNGADGFWIQSQSGGTIPIFYVDDISLTTAPALATNATASIIVNMASNRSAISPLIYGVAFGTSNQVADLNAPLNRSGGNNETRYNWQLNAHNIDNDWYFESVDDGSPVSGAAADAFVADSKNGGAQPMITIPMIGWAAKLGTNRSSLASYSVAKYGPQTGSDPYWSDAGNGISVTNNTPITWNDPNDANLPVNSAFQQGYVQHLTNKWGSAGRGGVGYYLMDNEHSLWFSTHRDVHPVGPTMQEIWGSMLDYATMVKSNEPNALVLGPEEWGWNGYFYSGYDQQWSGQNNNFNPADYPDRGANGGWDYMPWLLNQFRVYSLTNHQRLLDYFTLHCYPQEGDVSSDDSSPGTALLRNQSTRQFWDTNYVDPSWINSIIMLIPRMKNWVATYYPGTKIGITEYNWGAEDNLNGATAQADILGIFGREGLDLATRWTTPATASPTYYAMKMYRNYDGNKSTFGDTSVLAGGPGPDNVSVFAAQRSSDSALTIMVINKYLSGVTPISIAVTNFSSTGSAQVWQLNSTNVITHLSNLNVTAGMMSFTVPSPSITLLVLPASAQTFSLQAGPPRTDGQFAFTLNGTPGQTYIIQASSNLLTWSPISTNSVTNAQTQFLLPTSSSHQFYRARWLP